MRTLVALVAVCLSIVVTAGAGATPRAHAPVMPCGDGPQHCARTPPSWQKAKLGAVKLGATKVIPKRWFAGRPACRAVKNGVGTDGHPCK